MASGKFKANAQDEAPLMTASSLDHADHDLGPHQTIVAILECVPAHGLLVACVDVFSVEIAAENHGRGKENFKRRWIKKLR